LFLGDDGRHLLAYTPDEEGTPESAQSETGWWMRFLDLAEGREVWSREGDVPGFVDPTLSPNGKYVALPPSGGSTSTAVVLDLKDGKEVLSLGAQERQGFNFECFTSDGDHLVLTQRDEERKEMPVHVVEVRGGRQVGEWRAESQKLDQLTSGGVGVKGGYVAGEDEKNVVRVWEAFSGRLVRKIDLPPGIYLGVFFSPDGRHFAVPGFEDVGVWKLEGGDASRMFTISRNPSSGHTDNLIFSYNTNGGLLSVSTAGGVGVWDALTGCEVARVEAVGDAYVNRDGTRALAVTGGTGVAVWSKVGLGELLAEVCTHVTHDLSLGEWRKDYRLPADEPPLKCENIKDERKDEAADAGERGGACNLPAVSKK
ncbi:MAG TPA: WD40 repeat domain-containing protein, partial [Pyrinomonadaceae bacterium]